MLVVVRSTVINMSVGVSISRVASTVSSVSHRIVVIVHSMVVNYVAFAVFHAPFTLCGRTRCNSIPGLMHLTWSRLVSCTDVDR